MMSESACLRMASMGDVDAWDIMRRPTVLVNK